MKIVKVYFNSRGIINLCKPNLKLKPIEPGFEEWAETATLTYEELHFFMECNPDIRIANRMFKDSENRIYGGVILS
jgi:hypothetical protein